MKMEIGRADCYSILVRCSNCGYEGGIEVPKGTLVSAATCPKCGCKTAIRNSKERPTIHDIVKGL
ncbi:MAG: hypothetical protein WC763_05165 [Candidatus Paceibacterota bacterium]